MSSSASNLMWQIQEFLHKKPQAVPGTLLSIAGCLLIHRHMTEDADGGDPLKTFLALIIIQMLPLVALEMKIMSCADPVGLFCKFATPVTLVHGIFLTMRLCTWLYFKSYETGEIIQSLLGLGGALITLHVGFKESPLDIAFRCKNVGLLVFIALVAAFATNGIDSYVNPPRYGSRSWSTFFEGTLSTSNNYIELMAFIPAVWMVYRQDNRIYDDTDCVSTKRKASAFFLFLVGFYVTEDLFQACGAWAHAKVAAGAHIVHFMLLCDFACFVLGHIYNPEKLLGPLRKWLPADLCCDV